MMPDGTNYGLICGMLLNTLTPPVFKKIAVVGKYPAAGITESLSEIADFLVRSGYDVALEADTAAHVGLQDYAALTVEEIGACADVAIVVGGDGTMLGIARRLAPYDVPLIGINQGRLGFMTDITLDRVMPLLAEMLSGTFESEQRSLLEGSVIRESGTIYHALAFNDVVVSRGSGSGMVELRVHVDGRFMYNQRSDGLIVATPTGSTAYALSAGGPLLHPSLGGVVLVPIAPHALSNRPIVVPHSSEIVIELVSGRDTSVNFDMQSLASLQHHDCVIIRRSQHTITFLHPKGWSYYDTLREKLHWNEYPSAEGRLK
jgi:NAD+ kinase